MSKPYSERELKAAEYAAYVRGAIEWMHSSAETADILMHAHAAYPLPEPEQVQRVVVQDNCQFRWNAEGYVEWKFEWDTSGKWRSVKDYTVDAFTARHLLAIADVALTPYEIEE